MTVVRVGRASVDASAGIRAKRLRGEGTIVREDGKYRARLPGTKETVAYEDSYEAAEAKLRLAIEALSGAAPDDATRMSVGAWMAYHLALREREGVRDVHNERGRVQHHVVRDALGAVPMCLVDDKTARAWVARLCLKGGGGRGERRRGQPLSASTIANIIICVRVGFERARELGVIAKNPLSGIAVPRARKKEVRVADKWTVLEAAEQAALAKSLEEEISLVRAMVLVALATGLRRGELLALRWEDVHGLFTEDPWIAVRYGAPGKPTKGGRPRRIPLLAHGARELERWAARALARKGSYVDEQTKTFGESARPVSSRMSPTDENRAESSEKVDVRPLMGEGEIDRANVRSTKNRVQMPEGPVFPSDVGEHRTKIPQRGFSRALRRAGIDRKVRWHDLRHTCATSLLEGMWGPAWSVTEVQQLLGHKSAATTEVYLHARSRLVFRRARESYSFGGGA